MGPCVCFSPTHGILVDICRWKHTSWGRTEPRLLQPWFGAPLSCPVSNLPSQMAQTHPLGGTPLSPLYRSHNESVCLSFCLGDNNSFLGLSILFPAPHLNTTLPRALPMSDPICVSMFTHCGIDLHEDFALQLYGYKVLKTVGYFFWECHKAWSNTELPRCLRKAHRKKWPLDLVCCYLIDSWMLVHVLCAYWISCHLACFLTHFWQNSVTGSLSLLLLFFLCLCRNSWFFLY